MGNQRVGDTIRARAEWGYRRAEEAFAGHPAEAVLIGFGVGCGVGLLLTVALRPRAETWFERHSPGSISELSQMLSRMPETIATAISRQMHR